MGAAAEIKKLSGSEAVRQLMLWGLVGSAVVWGVLEFFALQRARYHGWRNRQQAALPR